MLLSAVVMGILSASLPADSECVQNPDADIVGRAADVETGEFLYCEYHFFGDDGKTTRVEYRKAPSRLFAKKLLRYTSAEQPQADPARPEVEQEDFRIGEKRQALWRGDKMVLRYKSAAEEPWRETQVAERRVDVVDGGFDVVVREHWDELIGGKAFAIGFASPVHQRSIKLQVTAKDRDKCDNMQVSDLAAEQLQCFYVEPKNRLLRWLVEPLQLVYDSQSRRLHQYCGVVNVKNGEGKSFSARITYYYQS